MTLTKRFNHRCQNFKSEIRNPKFQSSPKFENGNPSGAALNSGFSLRIYFGYRDSDFGFP